MVKRQSVDFLYLSEPEMIEAGVLNVCKCVEVMDDTFRLLGEGDFLMGGYSGASHGDMLWYPKTTPFPNMPVAGPDRRYMAMPAYLGGRYNCTGVKWYGSNITNPRERGLPRSILMMSLNDVVTGVPLAIMSANLMSAMRTGSVPGVATKYLARKDAETIGVIGCGVISRACTRGILVKMPNVKRIYLYDIVRASAEKLAEELKREFSIEMLITDTSKEAIVDADVISVAAAGAKPVVIEEKWLKKGCLYVATGHAELSDHTYITNQIIFDYWPMHALWYEEGRSHPDGIESTRDWAPSYQIFKLIEAGKVDQKNMISLSDVVTGKALSRKSDDDKIIFISGGLPIEDVAWSYTLYEEALKKGLGSKLNVWKQAHWL